VAVQVNSERQLVMQFAGNKAAGKSTLDQEAMKPIQLKPQFGRTYPNLNFLILESLLDQLKLDYRN